MVFDDDYLKRIERYVDIGEEDLVGLEKSETGFEGIYVHKELSEELAETSRADGEPWDELGHDLMEKAFHLWKQWDNLKDIEKGLQIHYLAESNDDVHEAISEVLDTNSLYDSSKPSSLERYDLFRTFKLKLDEDEQSWTNPRFAPSEIFTLLSNRGLGSEIIAVVLVVPIA